MKRTPSGSGSLFWFDRLPLEIQLQYAAATVAPHVDVQRATYTVPACRKAIITSVKVAVIRDVVAQTPHLVQAYVKYVPAGATTGNYSMAWFNNGTVGQGDMTDRNSSHVMLSGDVLSLRTADVSADGSCTYDLYVTIIEFAA